MELGVFLLFLVTTTIVVLSPGPAAMAVATQASANGIKRAMFGIFGVAFANVVYFVLSALGIASLIIASEMLFLVIKWVGVAYLVYLGLSAIFSKSGGLQIQKGAPEKPLALFCKGFIVEFANPKALLYFAAVLPQFIDLERSILPQILTMGSVTVLIDVTIYFGYAVLAHRIANSGMKGWVIKTINRVAGAGLLFAAGKMLSVTTEGA